MESLTNLSNRLSLSQESLTPRSLTRLQLFSPPPLREKREKRTKQNVIIIIETWSPLFGEPTKKLKAIEFIWMTDRTPHESLPIPTDSYKTNIEDNFSVLLLIGEISFWFTDHSTLNPTFRLSCSGIIPIIHGNEFALINKRNSCDLGKWSCESY